MSMYFYVILLILLSKCSCQDVTSTENPVDLSMIETPAFLKVATDSQRREYIELEGNPNLTIEMKEKALKNWAQRCKEPVNNLYIMYISERQTLQSQEDARMASIVAQLSPEAQEADRKVRAITTNYNQTKKTMDSSVSKLLDKLPKKVYYELTFATQ